MKKLICLFSLIALNAYAQQVYTVTAYCKCSICCGKWAKYGKTASGTTPKAGRTIAAPRSIPFGTKLYIEGIGERIVEDRLSIRYNSRIDLFMPTHAAAKKFGIRRLRVYKQETTLSKN